MLAGNNDVVVLILEGDATNVYVEDGIEVVLDDDDDVEFIYDDENTQFTIPLNDDDVNTYVDD